MNPSLSRRERIRAVTFLSAAFLVLGGLVIRLAASSYRYRQQVSLSHARAFTQLSESVGEMNTALEKSIYVTSPEMISVLCTQIYGEAKNAQQAIGCLPYGDLELEQTAAFVAKAGDYAQALSRSCALHRGYSGDELETVRSLSQAASALSEQLRELERQLDDGTLTLADTDAVEQRLSRLTEDGDLLAGSSYESVESEFPELPALIYDGPFSEHLQSRSAAMLEQEARISAKTARSYAAEFLGVDVNALQTAAEVEGELPCYVFDCSGERETCAVEVTKQGGYILSITRDREYGAETLTQEEGVQAAREFLQSHDIYGLVETYYIDQGNCLTVSFATEQDGVICYPDLIKVEVALDNGEIVGFESAGYLMNHTTRSGLQPWITSAEAQQAVSPELTVQHERLALIPTDGEYERLCWEFRCENPEGRHYLVYINARTGAEQQILILLEDETGTLTV